MPGNSFETTEKLTLVPQYEKECEWVDAITSAVLRRSPYLRLDGCAQFPSK